MSDRQTPAQAEAAAIRRRWITLGELVAVLAVLISGLTLWNSYSERTSAEAEREAAKKQAATKAANLVLRAKRTDNGNQLLLMAADESSVIQRQTFLFPSELDIDSVETVVEPRIEADWIEKGVKRVLRGRDEEGSGDKLLPVAISTRFTNDGTTYNYNAIYDIGYEIEGGGLLDRSDVRLRGLSQVRPVLPGEAQARLDRLWKSRQPAAAKKK
jgi:hypothetical protein